MGGHDSSDFLSAFAIGAVLGVGTVLLLRPDAPNPRRTLAKRLKPHARKGKRGRRSRIAAVRLEGGAEEYLTGGTRAAAQLRPAAAAPALETDEAIRAGRELLAEFRAEVNRILEEAREELQLIQDGESPGTNAVAEPAVAERDL
jgi:gas vesicle protein